MYEAETHLWETEAVMHPWLKLPMDQRSTMLALSWLCSASETAWRSFLNI